MSLSSYIDPSIKFERYFSVAYAFFFIFILYVTFFLFLINLKALSRKKILKSVFSLNTLQSHGLKSFRIIENSLNVHSCKGFLSEKLTALRQHLRFTCNSKDRLILWSINSVKQKKTCWIRVTSNKWTVVSKNWWR